MVRMIPMLLLAACAARTVRVEAAATPALSLDTSRVAVVARDRDCRPVADALVDAIGRSARIAVDPRAEVRLVVFGCGADIRWNLYQEVDAAGDTPSRRQRADLVGRAYGVVQVDTPAGVAAHLIGSSRDGSTGAWDVRDMVRSRRAMHTRLVRGVADDVAMQLSPYPQQLDRRVYPNAAAGTPRALISAAVLAEQDGHLWEALRLAREALRERPSHRNAEYVASLERRLHTASDTR